MKVEVQCSTTWHLAPNIKRTKVSSGVLFLLYTLKVFSMMSWQASATNIFQSWCFLPYPVSTLLFALLSWFSVKEGNNFLVSGGSNLFLRSAKCVVPLSNYRLAFTLCRLCWTGEGKNYRGQLYEFIGPVEDADKHRDKIVIPNKETASFATSMKSREPVYDEERKQPILTNLGLPVTGEYHPVPPVEPKGLWRDSRN